MEIILNILTLFLVVLLKPCFLHDETKQYWTFQLIADFAKKKQFFSNPAIRTLIKPIFGNFKQLGHGQVQKFHRICTKLFLDLPITIIWMCYQPFGI